jgi:hypothetical protein
MDFFGDTVTGPTCQIAALLYALVSDAEGPYLNRLSQRKPLSVSDICQAKLVTWHPVIPNEVTSCMARDKPFQGES